MKNLLGIILAIGLPTFACGEVFRFYILPKDSPPPDARSSLSAYHARTPQLGAPVLEVNSLVAVDPTTTRSVSRMHDATGRVTEETTQQVSSISIALPEGFREKFGKITEENIDHRLMITLGDWILMAPFVRQRIDTASILISLGTTANPEETAQLTDALRAMVKKTEANQRPEANAGKESVSPTTPGPGLARPKRSTQ